MRNQKAASALIATVILAAFAISAGIMVLSFMSSLAKSQTESVSSSSVCASKGALFIDYSTCARARDPSLVGYWKLDSVNASNYTLDSTNYHNDGKLYNGSTSCFNLTGCINLTAGQIGNALQFDGVDDYVDAGNGASLNITDAVTIEGWINVKGSSGLDRVIFAESDDGGYGCRIAQFEVLSCWLRINNSWQYIAPAVPYTFYNEWHHIAATYDSSTRTQKLYLDGNLKSEGTLSGLSSYTIQPGILASRIGVAYGQYFNGSIDEVRIYNRSLSADEISQHYQKGLEKFAVDGYFKTIKASVRNIGSTPLSNFTVFADINGRLYQNDTPLNGGAALPGGSEPLTLQAFTYYDGPIKTLKVSVLNCPISMSLTNDSTPIGTC